MLIYDKQNLFSIVISYKKFYRNSMLMSHRGHWHQSLMHFCFLFNLLLGLVCFVPKINNCDMLIFLEYHMLYAALLCQYFAYNTFGLKCFSHLNLDFANIAFTLWWNTLREIVIWKLSQYEPNFYPQMVTILKEKLKAKSYFGILSSSLMYCNKERSQIKQKSISM